MGLHDRRQIFGVKAATIDERRPPAAQESEPKHIETRRESYSSAMNDFAAAIENGCLKPRISSDVTGRPNNRPDALAPKIERQRIAGDQNWRPRCGIGGRCFKSVSIDTAIYPIQDAQHARMRSPRGLLEVAAELSPCVVNGCKAANQANALVAENSEVEVAVVGTTHQLQ